MNDVPTSLVVCDAGPLIHLNQLECLDLLADFSRVLMPEVVWEEVHQHGPSALNQLAVRLERVRPRGTPSAELTALHRLLALDRGETQALQIVLEVGAGLLLTDDTAARLAAQNLNLPVHGTLGILSRAIRRKQKTPEEVLAMLRALPTQSTLHVKRSLLEGIIRQVEELRLDR